MLWDIGGDILSGLEELDLCTLGIPKQDGAPQTLRGPAWLSRPTESHAQDLRGASG